MPTVNYKILYFALCFQLFACSSGRRNGGHGEADANADVLATEVAPVREGGDEGDESDSSDKVPSQKPQLVTSLTISLDEVATELSVPRTRLNEQAQILAGFLKTGVVAQNYCNDENDPKIEKLCSLMDTVHDENPAAWVSKDSSHGRKVLIRPKNFSTLQKMGYGRLMRSIGRESPQRVLQYMPKLLAATGCPRNLSAVSIRKLEALLPSDAARIAMEKLYDNVSSCLQADDEAYEVTHLRQALLRHFWGNKKGALDSIRKAVLDKDSFERSRVLYWAGRLESDAAVKAKYWDRLVEQYPLSFHSLEVWREKKMDPFEVYSRRAPIGLERLVISNDEADEAVRWLEVLYIRGHVESAQRLARWIIRVYKTELSVQNILYISSLKSSRGTQLNSLTFLTRQVNENSDILNGQTLRMLFPRPYYEIFDKAASQTDIHLLLSVARQESGFDPQARSHANARGLLQLLPGTARLLSGKRNNDLYDEETNTQLGAKFLSQLCVKFGGSVELALAGYNAGPGHIQEWKDRYAGDDRLLFIDLIPFKETRNYVSNIFRNNYWYERLYTERSHNELASDREPAALRLKSDYVLKMVGDHRAYRDQMQGKALDEYFHQSTPNTVAVRTDDASEEPAQEVTDSDLETD